MEDEFIIELIEKTLALKMSQNANIIKYSFYEVRVKCNLTEKETDRFLELIRTKLENDNYKVYFTGGKYEYQKQKLQVEENELLVAIKMKD